MKLHIIPLKGKKDSYGKAEAGKYFPSWKKAKLWKKEIPSDANTVLITGNHPTLNSLQIVVLDYDGIDHGMVSWDSLSEIQKSLDEYGLEPYMIRRSGNGGFHFIFVCDNNKKIKNQHRRKLKRDVIKKLGVEDIDVRGNGGLVYFDCKFTDTDYYRTILKQPTYKINSSIALLNYVNEKRPEEIKSFGSVPTSTPIYADLGKRPIINYDNNRRYGIPDEYINHFNLLRQAVQDIWTGAYIITKSQNEFRKWAIFWRECLYYEIPENVIMARLKTMVQPEFEEKETEMQLKFMRYKYTKPSDKYYRTVFPDYK